MLGVNPGDNVNHQGKTTQLNFWKILRFWFPAAAYSGIIFYVSSIPALQAPLDFDQADKLCHLAEYLPFGFLTARAMAKTKMDLSRPALIVWVMLISFAYAVTDEFHQSFVPGRYATVFDVIADATGGLLGVYVYLLFKKYYARKAEQEVQQ